MIILHPVITQRIIHPFGPLYGPKSRILILGSFPSIKSREQEATAFATEMSLKIFSKTGASFIAE